MKLKNITSRDVIEMALEALPSSQEEYAIVLVDVRDGSVEVIKDTVEFESWARDTFDIKKAIFGIKKESAAGLDVDTLYKKYKHEICCSILELKEEHPHLA